MKLLQHTSETSKTLKTYICNIHFKRNISLLRSRVATATSFIVGNCNGGSTSARQGMGAAGDGARCGAQQGMAAAAMQSGPASPHYGQKIARKVYVYRACGLPLDTCPCFYTFLGLLFVVVIIIIQRYRSIGAELFVIDLLFSLL